MEPKTAHVSEEVAKAGFAALEAAAERARNPGPPEPPVPPELSEEALRARLAEIEAQKAASPEEPVPDVTLFDPAAQKAYDRQTIHQAVANVRQQLSQAKVSWRLVQEGLGPERPKNVEHPEQIAKWDRRQISEHEDAIRVSERRLELLIALKEEIDASEAGIPGPVTVPSLHIPTTEEIQAISKPSGGNGAKTRKPRAPRKR